MGLWIGTYQADKDGRGQAEEDCGSWMAITIR